jgi:hypothetical protein
MEFSFAPVDGVSVRDFIDVIGRQNMESIMHSFQIEYTSGSNMFQVIEHPFDLKKLIEEKSY